MVNATSHHAQLFSSSCHMKQLTMTPLQESADASTSQLQLASCTALATDRFDEVSKAVVTAIMYVCDM
jgi:hypothetical protein